MTGERNYSTEHKPTFQEWVLQHQGQSCREIYENFKATGSLREYQKAMDYLRDKYQIEMENRELLIAANPFFNKEEN